MGGAILSKSLIQFSVDEWGCISSLLFTWGQTIVEVMKIMETSFKGPMHAVLHSVLTTLHQATGDPHPSAGAAWTLLGKSESVSCRVTARFSWILMSTRFVCALQVSASPVLCKFWYLYGGVNGDLLQEGLCHAQVYCTQSPCPYGSPLLTCTSGDTQTQFCLSLCGVSGSWLTQGLFEPSEHL